LYYYELDGQNPSKFYIFEILIYIMPALFGIVCNDGIVSDAEITAMQKVYAREDREIELYKISEKVTFACCYFKNNKEISYFFKTNSERRLSVLATARLDNRPELEKLLGLFQSNDITDSECVYYAYLKWGTDVVNHLKGDWCFAAWDESEQRLMLARDQYGITSMYYAVKDNTLYFSSLIQAISVFDCFGKDINLRRVAELVCGYFSDGYSTFFENIKILSPAHYLLFDQRLQRVNYWQPAVKVQYGRKEADVYEELRYLLRNAVERRMPKYGNLGISQSGGFDSNAVAAFAAMIAAEKGEKIYCYTAVPKYDVSNFPLKHRNPDEGDIAASLARMYPNIVHKRVSDGPYTVMSGIEKALEAHGQPVHAVINAHWIFNILDLAQKDGCTVTMNGQHGNYSISWPPWRMNQSILKKKIKALYYRYSIDFFDRVIYLYHHYERLKLIKNLTSYNLHQIIDEIENEKKDNYRKYQTMSMKEKQVGSYFFESSVTGLQLAENAFNTALNIFDPTMDIDLIEFCLSLPDHFYFNQDNSRLLVKQGLKQIIPINILEQTKRGRQNADIFSRIENELKYISNCNSIEMFNFDNSLHLFQNVIENNNQIEYKKLNITSKIYAINLFLFRKKTVEFKQ